MSEGEGVCVRGSVCKLECVCVKEGVYIMLYENHEVEGHYSFIKNEDK